MSTTEIQRFVADDYSKGVLRSDAEQPLSRTHARTKGEAAGQQITDSQLEGISGGRVMFPGLFGGPNR